VEADLSQLHSSLTPYKNGSRGIHATVDDVAAGRAYYHVEFHLRLFVAQTSLKARLIWTERVSFVLALSLTEQDADPFLAYTQGIKREGPATVVLVDSADRAEGAQTRRRLPADIVAEHA